MNYPLRLTIHTQGTPFMPERINAFYTNLEKIRKRHSLVSYVHSRCWSYNSDYNRNNRNRENYSTLVWYINKTIDKYFLALILDYAIFFNARLFRYVYTNPKSFKYNKYKFNQGVGLYIKKFVMYCDCTIYYLCCCIICDLNREHIHKVIY